MKNRPWKKWKTRKATLIFSVLCVCAYIVIGILMGFLDHSLDSTLTEQVFSFFKWLVITGCAITVSKVIKGKTNSDCDEDFPVDFDLNSEEEITDEEDLDSENEEEYDEDLNYKEETNIYKEAANVLHQVKGEAIDIVNETVDTIVGRKIK